MHEPVMQAVGIADLDRGEGISEANALRHEVENMVGWSRVTRPHPRELRRQFEAHRTIRGIRYIARHDRSLNDILGVLTQNLRVRKVDGVRKVEWRLQG